MTQVQLARESGVSQSLIAKLERGRLNPSYESVRLILDALERHGRRHEVTAAELMHRDPVSVRPAERLASALALMKEHGFSQLPVLDRGKAIGQVSEGAILRRLERGERLESLRAQPVRDVMEAPMPMVAPDTRRGVLVEILKDEAAVLVVEADRVVGVVTKPDLW